MDNNFRRFLVISTNLFLRRKLSGPYSIDLIESVMSSTQDLDTHCCVIYLERLRRNAKNISTAYPMNKQRCGNHALRTRLDIYSHIGLLILMIILKCIIRKV